MVSEPYTIHTESHHQMAESLNTAAVANTTSNVAVDTIALFTISNIHSYITAKLQLDEQNYMAWLYQFQPILRTNDLMGIVDGTEPCPPRFIPGPTKENLTNLTLNSHYEKKKD